VSSHHASLIIGPPPKKIDHPGSGYRCTDVTLSSSFHSSLAGSKFKVRGRTIELYQKVRFLRPSLLRKIFSRNQIQHNHSDPHNQPTMVETLKTLSTGTLNLRFMQNARRAQQLDVELEKAHVKDDAEWEVAPDIRKAWGNSDS
jgi:hypothetical protein